MVEVPLRGTCFITLDDQAANPAGVLAWSFAQSRVFDPLRIYDAIHQMPPILEKVYQKRETVLVEDGHIKDVTLCVRPCKRVEDAPRETGSNQCISQWARAVGCWIDDVESTLSSNLGSFIAEGGGLRNARQGPQ